MGTLESKCAELLSQMGWAAPKFAEEFQNPSLTSYLQVQNLEVILPKHAPQADCSIPDRMPSMYPRPNFCWEGYKMHLALIGPSTACKNQFAQFLPNLAAVFRGPDSKLGPGRNATPFYFLDEDLHQIIMWELPEMSWNQTNPEDYIREIGLMYMDCAFILFSEKYMLNDVYCKLIVHMAIHGIPFFVICTDSSENHDEQTMDRIKRYFQKRDIQGIRMLNPNNPGDMLKELITEFFKEVSWNRSCIDRERTADVDDSVLGQTVRLKDLEKKPELNGRCGVCVGFDKDQGRYHVRLITKGVESDIALKQNNFSILKPKMLRAMVQLKDLTSKPELNGRYGYVDAFLRETERYRVFIPDVPGQGLVLALKSANLDRVQETRGQPVKPPAPQPERMRRAASAKPVRPTYGPFVAESTGGQTWKVIGGESKGGIIVRMGKDFDSKLFKARLSTLALIEELARDGDRLNYRLLYGTGPATGWVSMKVQDQVLLVRTDTVVCGSRIARAAPTAPATPNGSTADRQMPSYADAPAKDKPFPSSPDAPAKDKPIPSYADLPAKDKPVPSYGDAPAKDKPFDPPAKVKLSKPKPESNGQENGGMPAPTPSASAPPARGDERAAAHPDGRAGKEPQQPRGQAAKGDLMSRLFGSEDDTGAEAGAAKPKAAEAAVPEPMDFGKMLQEAAEAGGEGGLPHGRTVKAPGASAAKPDAAEKREDAGKRGKDAGKRGKKPPPCKLKREGLFGMRVWAVVGDPDEAEDIMDHLMDCGKTVLNVCASGGQFSSVADLGGDLNLPQTQVLAFIDDSVNPKDCLAAAAQLGLRGLLLHPSMKAFPPGLEQRCKDAGLEVFAADILEEVQPGGGLTVAPLD